MNVSISAGGPLATASTNEAGGSAADAQLNQQTQQASGSVAEYMNQNGVDATDANGLHAMATNQAADVPQATQEGAAFVLANPQIMQQIEKHQQPGSDGQIPVRNFEQAAQGQVPVSRDATPAPASPGDEAPSLDHQALSASATIGQWMGATGTKSVDPNGLYALATNKGGEVPQPLQQAAGFMLAHPAIYQESEALHPAGTGTEAATPQLISSPTTAASSAAPQVLSSPTTAASVPAVPVSSSPTTAPSTPAVPSSPTTPPVAANSLQTVGPAADLAANDPSAIATPAAVPVANGVPQPAADALPPVAANALQAAGPAAPAGPAPVAGGGVSMQQILQLMQMLLKLMQAAGMGQQAPAPAPAGASPLQQALMGHATQTQMQGASGVLANYLQSQGKSAVNLDELKAMANNTGGKVPQDAQTAARMMLANPNGYRAIETHDVAQADGISGIWNFQAAAKGQIKF